MPRLADNLEVQTALTKMLGSCTSRDIRVLIIGENHYRPNILHDMAPSLLPVLLELGFTHLCLEFPYEWQEILTDFMRGNRSVRKFADMASDIQLRSARTTIHNGFPRKHFSDLKEAIGTRIRTVGVDTLVRPCYRDKLMFERIDALLRKESDARIIFWVGSLHGMHRRSSFNDAVHQTTAEWLSDAYGDHTIFSIAQISNFDTLFPAARKFMQSERCIPVVKQQWSAVELSPNLRIDRQLEVWGQSKRIRCKTPKINDSIAYRRGFLTNRHAFTGQLNRHR